MADADKDILAARVSADLKNSDSVGSSDEIVPEQAPLPKSKIARIYRSTLFNVIIVGLISFTQPGIWNALNSEFPGNQARSGSTC